MALIRKPYYVLPGIRGRYDPHPDHPKPPTLIELQGILKQEECVRLAKEERQKKIAEAKRLKELERQKREREAFQMAEQRRAVRALEEMAERARRKWWDRFWLIVQAIIAVIIALFLLYWAAYKTLIVFIIVAFIFHRMRDEF